MPWTFSPERTRAIRFVPPLRLSERGSGGEDMADRVLITTDDLEPAVRTNAALEQAGFSTAMVSSLDDVRASVSGKQPPPDAIVLTGGLHETTAQPLLAAAQEHGIPTLGFVEATDENPERI